MRKYTAIILSLLSLVISVAVALSWFIHFKNSLVTDVESYISVIVTSLGIIVTIVLGWQIYNVIDFKEKVAEIDELKTEFEKNIQIQNENNDIMQDNIIACSKFYSGKIADSLVNFMASFRSILKRADYSFEIEEAKSAIETLKKIVEIESAIHLYLNIDQYKIQHLLIQETSHYNKVKKEYEAFYFALIEKTKTKEDFIK